MWKLIYNVMEFRKFLEAKEDDISDTLSKLPKSHKKLVDGYKIEFQNGSSLQGDGSHVGYVDDEKKKIVIAAPWNYSRCHTLLHEIAHLIYKEKMTPELRKEWAILVKNTKNKQKQDAEELFAHTYACFYMKLYCPKICDHVKWNEFIEKKVPN